MMQPSQLALGPLASKRLLCGLIAAIAILPAAAPASAADRLQGAWAIEGASCNEVFTTRNGKVSFKRKSAEGWSGFIVNGKQVRGVNARCDLTSAKQKGDVSTLLLGCRSQVMFGSMSVSVRFDGDDKIVRFDPEFPEVTTAYNRCSR